MAAANVVHPFVYLVVVVDIAQVARGVAEAGVALSRQRDSGDAAIVESVGDANLRQDTPDGGSLVGIQRHVAHEPDTRRVDEPGADRPRVLHHDQLAGVGKEASGQGEQAARDRRRVLMQELPEQHLSGVDRVVQADAPLIVVQRVGRIAEQVGWVLAKTRARQIVFQQVG